MRCSCCDRLLTDFETSFKSKATEAYLDTCSKCLNGLNIPYTSNYILDPVEGMIEEVLELDDPPFEIVWDDYEID